MRNRNTSSAVTILATDAPVAPGISNPDVVALLLAKTTTSEERGVRLVVDPASAHGLAATGRRVRPADRRRRHGAGARRGRPS